MALPKEEVVVESGAVAALRRAALEAGQAGGVFLVHCAGAREFAAAARSAVEEDGVAWVQARATGAAPLDPARALVRSIARVSRHEGPAALARRAWEALGKRDRATMLVLLHAHRADERTARWFWSLARRLAQPGAPALLVAVLDPEESLPGSPWSELEARLAAPLGARRIAEEAPPISAEIARGELPSTLRRVLAAVLAGKIDAAARAVEAAAENSAREDDLAAEAEAEISAALMATVAGSPESALLLEAARAAAEIAGDATLASAVAGVAALHHAIEGDLGKARRAIEGAEASPLMHALAVHTMMRAGDLESAERANPPAPADPAIQGWLGALLLGSRDRLAAAAEGLERARWPLLAGRAWLDAEDLDRARACFERAGARALVARVDQARAPGLSSAGRAVSSGGAPETVEALAPLAAAATRDEVLVSALDAALGMIASRGGAAVGGRFAIALRGRTSLVGAADARLSVAVRSPRTGVELGRLSLDRLTDDPPFSRDERRLVESIARFAGAAVDRCDSQAATRERERRLDPPPLDARLALVEKQTLIDALARHEGNLSRTARTLGLSRNGLKMKLARHGLR